MREGKDPANKDPANKDPGLFLLLGVVMFAVTGGSLVGPILPEMLSLSGATPKNIGLALSSYTFCAMVATPLLGPVADRFGRKSVIVPSVMLFGAAGLVIVFTRSFWLLLLWRGLQGIAVGGMMNTVVAALGDMYEEPDRTRVMGYRMTVQGLTNSAVPFVSGAIATLAWFLPFCIHALALILGLLAFFKLREPASSGKKPRYIARALAALANVRAIWLFFSNFAGFLMLYDIIVYMPILVVRHFGFSTLHSGLAISTGAGVAALTASQSGRLSTLVSEELRVLCGFLLCGLSHLLIGFAGSYPVLLGFMLLWGFGFGTLMPTLNAAAAGLVGTELRAGVLSVFTLLIYLGQTVSPPFFALFVQDSAVRGAFYAGAAVSLLPLGFTLYVLLYRAACRQEG
ncbi:MAG: MFS transporter [Desulfosalsimonadaceae bacterium]